MDVLTECRCPQCGSDEVEVVRQYTGVSYFKACLPCKCEDGDSDEAANRSYHRTALMEQVGHFDEHNEIEFGDPEEVEEIGYYHEDQETYCSCAEDAVEADWMTRQVDYEEIDEEILLCCNGCGHEELVKGAA